MTEDEAKMKICCGPQVVAMATLLTLPSGQVEITGAGRCIASACMAWRDIVKEIPVLRDGSEVEPGHIYLSCDVVTSNRRVVGGYCGLAGVPQ
jgi:hypothetical protein